MRVKIVKYAYIIVGIVLAVFSALYALDIIVIVNDNIKDLLLSIIGFCFAGTCLAIGAES